MTLYSVGSIYFFFFVGWLIHALLILAHSNECEKRNQRKWEKERDSERKREKERERERKRDLNANIL